MIVQALAVLMLLAQSPVAPASTPAAETPKTEASQPDEGFAKIDAALRPWKGKKADRLRGQLGLSRSSTPSSNGEVVFWDRQLESTACDLDAGGRMRCGSADGLVCRLGIAIDKQGQVLDWRPIGNPKACELFLPNIGQP